MSEEVKTCQTCGLSFDLSQFYYSHNLKKHPDGKLDICKDCLCKTPWFNVYDPAAFIPVLQEVDIPYIHIYWNSLVVKWDGQPKAVLGRYLSKMKLYSFKNLRYKDTAFLEKNGIEHEEKEKQRAWDLLRAKMEENQ